MLQSVMSIFSGSNTRRDALATLTRIISRHELVRMGFDTGHEVDQRVKDEYDVSLGVWLFPCEENAAIKNLDVAQGVPAVTGNLRAGGLGIMTPMLVDADHVFIGVPDDKSDTIWNFFRGHVRHNTLLPGGWYHMGVQVEALVELNQSQRVSFRKRVDAMKLR